MNRAIIWSVLSLLALPAVAGVQAKPGAREKTKGLVPHPISQDPRENTNLQCFFKIRFKELEGEGNFRVLTNTQANYVLGSDKPFEIQTGGGKGVEYKKFGTIVNVLPALSPTEDVVDSMLQIELSGPGEPEGALKARPLRTFQLQTEFNAPLGQWATLVDEPDRRVEVKFERAK